MLISKSSYSGLAENVFFRLLGEPILVTNHGGQGLLELFILGGYTASSHVCDFCVRS